LNEVKENIDLTNYIHFYDENLKDKFQKIKNKKTNLLLNLNLFKKIEKIKALKKIAKLELKISDYYLKNNNFELASDSIFSAINSLVDIRADICYNIALKGLITKIFNDKVFREFFRVIKDLRKSTVSNNYEFFKHIINQYVENSYPFKLQNLIKIPFYIFWMINFEDILDIKLNPYIVSRHPIYSKELSEHLKNLEKNRIIKIKKMILPGIFYQIVRNTSFHYRTFIIGKNKNLIFEINQYIEDFAFFNTNQITDWEKKIKILDYFSTAERII